MLKDNLYGYGYVTTILNLLFIVLVFLMYLGATINYVRSDRLGIDIYYLSTFLLFFVLIVKCIWYFCVTRPMCFTNTITQCFMVRFNLFIIYLILFVIMFGSIFTFILNSYIEHSVDVKKQISYSIFNVTIIHFSVIKFLGCILENTFHIDIINCKNVLYNCVAVLFKIVLPFFIFLLIIQFFYSKRKYKYF